MSMSTMFQYRGSPNADEKVALSVTEDEEVAWPNRPDEYELHNVIGCGDAAIVYSAYCKLKRETCAIKKISLLKGDDTEVVLTDEIMACIENVTSVDHKNIMTNFTSFISNNELWLVLKLFEGGSLMELIRHKSHHHNCTHGVFDEVTIASVLKSVLRALEYLHNKGLSHGNIRAANLLVGGDGCIKVADYGTNTLMYHVRERDPNEIHTSKYQKYVGSAWWMAPEVVTLGSNDCRGDIWSLGITAIELVRGVPPNYEYHPMRALMLTLLNDPPTIRTGLKDPSNYKHYRKVFNDMIALCLRKDPDKRPSATELLQHSFIKKSKSRSFLFEKLVALCPTLEARINKTAKRKARYPGRLTRTYDGEWQWSEDEDDIISRPDFAPCFCNEPENTVNGFEESEFKSISSESSEKTLTSHVSFGRKSTLHKSTVLKLTLEIRNVWKKLIQVSFEYRVANDTPEKLGDELVSAGLVDPRDGPAVILSLEKLLTAYVDSETKTITFLLNSPGPNEHFDDKKLVGFAKLSIL